MTNADGSPGFTNNVAASGSQVLSNLGVGTYTFRVTATNVTGSVTQTTQLTVYDPNAKTGGCGYNQIPAANAPAGSSTCLDTGFTVNPNSDICVDYQAFQTKPGTEKNIYSTNDVIWAADITFTFDDGSQSTYRHTIHWSMTGYNDNGFGVNCNGMAWNTPKHITNTLISNIYEDRAKFQGQTIYNITGLRTINTTPPYSFGGGYY
jgi:hypothetical protein